MDSEMKLQSTISDVARDIGYGVPVSKEVVPEKAATKESDFRKSKMEDLAYGEPVYWATILGSIVVIIGGILAFCTKANYVATSYWISSVWEGKSTTEIWDGAVNDVPQGHWYLHHLFTGDGLQSVGFAICFVAITVGLLAACVFLLRNKSKLFAAFAFIASLIMLVSIFGLIPE